jgi:hypothetical protein
MPKFRLSYIENDQLHYKFFDNRVEDVMPILDAIFSNHGNWHPVTLEVEYGAGFALVGKVKRNV